MDKIHKIKESYIMDIFEIGIAVREIYEAVKYKIKNLISKK